MNINWATPTIDIFNLDYPPIINIFRQPSKPFSLDSSQALTPIVLGCSSAYGMHVCQFQYSLIHMQIYKHEYIHIKIKSHNHVMKFLIHHIKISSRGLMIKHKQFNLNHLTKHIFSQFLLCEITVSGSVKP